MKSREVYPRLRDERHQAPRKLHWAWNHMRGAIIVRSLQRNDDIAIIGQ